MLTIFVGSSGKNLPAAQKVCKILKDGKLNPVLWNSHGTFPAGEVTLKALIDLSQRCHGAVFVFGEDDEVYQPDRSYLARLLRLGPTYFVPRDNVLIEYGLFVARLGSKKTIVYKTGRVKETSDLKGITYLTDHNIAARLVADLKSAYEDEKGASVQDRLVMHVSTALEASVRTGTIPSGWYCRAMYIGSQGANAWAALERDDVNYHVSAMRNQVAAAIRQMAKDGGATNVSSIISFGPGVGLLDKAVVGVLAGDVPPKYIPIDINDHLAMIAAKEVDEAYPNVRVPFCIVADFERDMNTIHDVINKHTLGPRVFMMLGATFGNIETSESAFLCKLKDCMSKEDFAILDVSIQRDAYTFANDTYQNLSANPNRTTALEFLIAGIKRRFPDIPTSSLPPVKGPELVTATPTVDGTVCFRFYCEAPTDKRQVTLMLVRRYIFDKFGTYLQSQGFTVVQSNSIKNNTDHPRGVYLIKKS